MTEERKYWERGTSTFFLDKQTKKEVLEQINLMWDTLFEVEGRFTGDIRDVVEEVMQSVDVLKNYTSLETFNAGVVAINESIELLNEMIQAFDVEPDLSAYPTRDEVQGMIPLLPDLSVFYSKGEVDALFDAVPAPPDVSVFYKKEEVDALIAEMTRPDADLSAYPTRDEVEAMIPSTAGFYTREDVDNLFALYDVDLSAYPTRSEVEDMLPEVPAAPDLSIYYNKTEVDTLLQSLDLSAELSDVYRKAEVDGMIPDVSVFYTKAEVDALIDALDFSVDLSDFVTLDEVRALIPAPTSLTGYYDKTQVNALLDALDFSVDLSPYPTRDEVADMIPEPLDTERWYEKSEVDAMIQDLELADTRFYTMEEVDALIPELGENYTMQEVDALLATQGSTFAQMISEIDTSVDLSGIYTREQVDALLGERYSNVEISNAINFVGDSLVESIEDIKANTYVKYEVDALIDAIPTGGGGAGESEVADLEARAEALESVFYYFEGQSEDVEQFVRDNSVVALRFNSIYNLLLDKRTKTKFWGFNGSSSNAYKNFKTGVSGLRSDLSIDAKAVNSDVILNGSFWTYETTQIFTIDHPDMIEQMKEFKLLIQLNKSYGLFKPDGTFKNTNATLCVRVETETSVNQLNFGGLDFRGGQIQLNHLPRNLINISFALIPDYTSESAITYTIDILKESYNPGKTPLGRDIMSATIIDNAIDEPSA